MIILFRARLKAIKRVQTIDEWSIVCAFFVGNYLLMRVYYNVNVK